MSNTPEENRPRHITCPRHGKQQAAATETQNTPAPPHLSNEQGAERYDDRAEWIASRPRQRRRRKARTKDTKQARQGETTTARETDGPTDNGSRHERAQATSNRATTHDDGNGDAPPSMSKERGEGQYENEPAGLSNSFSSLIVHRTESRAVLSIIHTAPFSPAHRKPQEARGGRRKTYSVHMK